jgi:hypothetical protein
MTNYPTENRQYKPQFKPPVPVLTMSVNIEDEWSEDFRKLQKILGKGAKETINWVVNQWFINAKSIPTE